VHECSDVNKGTRLFMLQRSRTRDPAIMWTVAYDMCELNIPHNVQQRLIQSYFTQCLGLHTQ